MDMREPLTKITFEQPCRRRFVLHARSFNSILNLCQRGDPSEEAIAKVAISRRG